MSPRILAYFEDTCFNSVLRRLVAWIRSSLLVKIQWQKHHYTSEHGCYSVLGTCSHVIIMTQKEGGARIIIKESSIKAIEMWQVLENAPLIPVNYKQI
jgi:hypothetical protein